MSLLSPERAALAYREAVLPAVTIDGGISEVAFDELRVAAKTLVAEPFDVADRGHYGLCREPLPERPLAELIELAERCTGTSLACVEQRWTWLRRGDYSLRRDDVLRLPAGRKHVDVTIDLSDAACPEAQVVFTHREQACFSVPQAPGAIAIVALGPTVGRYDRYLTHRVGDHVVVRARLVFELAQAARR